MGMVFFPSCKTKADYRSASAAPAAYIRAKCGVEPIGCCRVNHQKRTPDDTALVVCNNCAAILEESSNAGKIEFVWELIDQDENFPFPDYHGEQMTVQDCWIAVEKRKVQDTVRSLLRKRNIDVVERPENHEKTRFCGVNLLAPCTKSNAQLAHRRYVEEGSHMFTPMSEEEQRAHFRAHGSQIMTDKVVCCCKFCRDGINRGAKTGIHLLELLFPAAE